MRHVLAPGYCERCEMDILLFGETAWDGDTGENFQIRNMIRKTEADLYEEVD